MTYCARCGGVFNKETTVHEGEDGKLYHYYCSWKIWQEHKRELEEKTAGNRPVATPPKAVK